MTTGTLAPGEFVADSALLFPASPSLQCVEELNPDADEDEHGSRVLFHCTVKGRRFSFGMRDASIGVLLGPPYETSKVPSKPLGAVDPFFFDPGYNLFAATGFSLWPESRLMLEALTTPLPRFDQIQRALQNGRIIELGAGIGMVGTCLVDYCQHVCLSDLPTLVEHGLEPNLERNAVPEQLASTLVIDWTCPVPEQAKQHTWDLVVANGCLLIKKFYQHALDTADALMSKRTQFLFTYQRRGVNEMYTTLEQVLDAIHKRGWKSECLAWRLVSVGRDGAELDSRNELFLWRVTKN